MAGGPEHYAEAEKCLGRPSALEYGSDEAREQLLEAQVHATLAHAAATALSEGGMMPGGEFDAWAAVCASQPIPAADPAQMYWLDDGHESAAPPDIYTGSGRALAAGVKRFRDDNPQSADAQCVWSPATDDEPGALELVAAGRATGIFVRPIRPKDAA